MNSKLPRTSMPAQSQETAFPYEGFELTPHYELDRLVLLVREPAWVYAYWDISSVTRTSVLGSLPKGSEPKLFLRVYRLNTDQSYAYFDIELTPFADSWHVYVGSEYMKVAASIGYKTCDGKFYEVVRSMPIEKYGEPDEEKDEVMTITDLYPKDIHNSGTSPQAWMRETTTAATKRRWIDVPQGPMTTPLLDLDLNVEVLLTGRTNPNAALTINGIRIPTDENGNFSVKYPLPDSTLIIPIQATLPNESTQITVTSVITRNTYKAESSRKWSRRQEV